MIPLQGLFRWFWCAVTAVIAASCTIKPLPQDVAGVNTYYIVQRIRCEVRDEVRSNIFQFIRTAAGGQYAELAKQLHDGKIDFATVPRSLFDPATQRILNRYDGAAVTYDFTFDITEDNNNTASLDLLRPFKKAVGMDKISFGAGADFMRQNQRLLRVHDSFAELLSLKYPERFCRDKATGENGFYPITGKINVQDQVFTFLSLNQSGNLDALKDTGTAPALSDNIKFTTKLSGDINPMYVLSPVRPGFDVSGAMLKLEASRQDIHQVIIVFSLPIEGINRTDRFQPRLIAERRAREEALVERARNVELIGEIAKIANRIQ